MVNGTFNYDSLSYASVNGYYTAYAPHTAVSGSLQVGSIVIIKLSYSNAPYAIMRVQSVERAGTDCDKNFSFAYKVIQLK